MIVNHDESGVADAELERIAAAVEVQIHRELAHAWGSQPDIGDRIRAARVFAGHRVASLPSDWCIEIDQHAVRANERPLQYVPWGAFHGVRDGVPYAKVRSLGKLSRSLSHEALEMLINPMLKLGFPRGRGAVAGEICDPVTFAGYAVDGVDVANFVSPRWYGAGAGPYDMMRSLSEPWELAPGGFCETRDEHGHTSVVQRPMEVPIREDAARDAHNLAALRRIVGRN